MENSVLKSSGDPMGAAIYDYHKNGKAGKLRVFSSQFDEDEIPVADLFRSFEDMPELEQVALKAAQGRILDVGAGSGCHSIALTAMIFIFIKKCSGMFLTKSNMLVLCLGFVICYINILLLITVLSANTTKFRLSIN